MKLKFRYRMVHWLAPILAAIWTALLCLLALTVRAWARAAALAGKLRDRVALVLVRIRVHYFLEVSECAKCPACGIRAKHTIVWAEVYQAVVHECKRCKARWGEKPIVTLEAWHVKPILPEGAPSEEVKTTTKIRQVV